METQDYASQRKVAVKLERKFADRLSFGCRIGVPADGGSGGMWSCWLREGWLLGDDRYLVAPDAARLTSFLQAADPVPVRWTW